MFSCRKNWWHYQSSIRLTEGELLIFQINFSGNILHLICQVYWLPAPVFIMGVVASLAGVLAVFFPETLGEKLPETIEDAIK